MLNMYASGLIGMNSRDEIGGTPLIYASLNGHSQIVTELLEAGADPHLRNLEGWLAIDVARRRGQPEVVGILSRHF